MLEIVEHLVEMLIEHTPEPTAESYA